MKFDLSDEQKQMAETLDRYFAAVWDSQRLHAHLAGGGVLDRAGWRKMSELGLFYMVSEPTQPGDPLALDAAVCAEQVGRHAVPGPVVPQMLAMAAIGRLQSAGHRDTWLAALGSGDAVASFAFGKAGAPVLAPCARDADLLVIVDLADGHIWVHDLKRDGVAFGADRNLDLTRRASVVAPADPPLHAEHVPGLRGWLRDLSRVLVAADAFGGASRCVEMATDYASSRQQFGQPIGRFQGLKFQIADMAVEVEPWRALWWYAAHAIDVGRPDASRMACLAKAVITESYASVGRRTVEVFGGIGFTWDADVHIFLKRAMFDLVWPQTAHALYAEAAEERALAGIPVAGQTA